MDPNWRPAQGSNPTAAAGGDWRSQLQPEARSNIVNKILETLKKHLPVSSPEGLIELQQIAARFEEKIYTAATSQADYLRKISLKLVSVETGAQQAPGNAQVILDQNNHGQASVDSTAQTGRAGDWQEEIYQMIKSLKGQHFAELNVLFNEISLKLQHVDSIIPRQMPSGQYGRFKSLKKMVERILQFLQISKSTIQASMRDKVPRYEKQIISILSSQRRKPVQPRAQHRFQPPAGQAPNSNILQQHQPPQSLQQHDSPNTQASLPSMGTRFQSSSTAGIQHVPAPPTANFSVPAHRNGATRQRQAGPYSDAAQGSNFNSWQYGSMGGALQPGNTWPMQGTMNAQLQTGMLSHNSMSMMQPNANSAQENARGVQQQFQPPAGQAPNSNILQQRQPPQSLQQHDSPHPQASLPSMGTRFQSSSTPGIQHVPAPPTENFSVPAHRNGATRQRQAGSYSDAAQGSNFNSWQYGSMGAALQPGSTWPMQGTMNAQPQTGMLSHNSMSRMQPNANSAQENARGLRHLSEPRKHMPKRSWSDAF